jgi:hypothetical protein
MGLLVEFLLNDKMDNPFSSDRASFPFAFIGEDSGFWLEHLAAPPISRF